MHFVYILRSQKYKRTYIGSSKNIEERLSEHNSGMVRSTKFYKPYNLIHKEVFATKSEARKRETELKNNSYKKEVLFKSLGLL